MPETPLSRRHFLLSLAALGIAAPSSAWCAEEKAELEILVDNDGWGSSTTPDIRALVLSAAQQLWRWCPGELIRPVSVYHRSDFPQTDFVHDWHGRIRIGLACEDARWAQMAFQFGHEFCHALAQHSAAAKRSWHPPRHANLWFEESLCETASLFVLRRMAEAWKTDAPYPNWKSYAAMLAAYATERLAKPEHQLPEGQPFGEWFRSNEATLRENPVLRDKAVIIARQMLPLFEATPTAWDSVCYLNLGQHKDGKSLREHLTEWQTATPAGLKAFVARLASLFGG